MVSEQDGVWIQSGIGSFGFGCARPNLPAVYSRVSRYQSWISSHIGSDEPGFAQFNSGGRDVDSNSSCPPPPPEVAPSQEPDPISKTPSPTLPSPTGTHLLLCTLHLWSFLTTCVIHSLFVCLI